MRYWQSLDELDRSPENGRGDEFAEELPVGEGAAVEQPSRRTFFQMMGLSSLAAVAACNRRPLQKIIPYVVKPEEITPGVPLWYASVCGACSAGCGTLVKTRDGRPIKIEGNQDHPFSKGALCALGQASVLGLYDADRLRQPLAEGKPSTTAAVDAAMRAALAQLTATGKSIWLVTGQMASPSTRAAVDRFLAAIPGARHAIHEPLGTEAIADAHEATHGSAVIPAYHFDRAAMLVSFGADFLGTWIAPAAFTRQYADARRLRDGRRTMLRHDQIEPLFSLSGSNADHRIVLAPRDERAALLALLRRLSAKRDAPWLGEVAALFSNGVPAPPPPGAAHWDELADRLADHPGRSLVISGSADATIQMLVNVANQLLGAYGATLDAATPLFTRPPGASRLGALFEELQSGRVGAVIFHGTNPVYDHARGADLERLIRALPVSAALGDRLDETAAACRFVVPDHHPLEAWNDAAPRDGYVGLAQPTVAPLWQTRAGPETLLAWAGESASYYDFLRSRWAREVRPAAVSPQGSFEAFWDQAVHDGGAAIASPDQAQPSFLPASIAQALSPSPRRDTKGVQLVLHASLSVGDGRMANNGWLQELPDPISKVTWSNCASLSPALARQIGVRDGDIVEIAAGETTVELPALVQPGQHDGVVGVALGYGRIHAGRIGNGVGANAYPLGEGGADIRLTRKDRRRELAKSQTHASMEGRPLVRETTLGQWMKDAAAGNDAGGAHGAGPRSLSLWPKHEYRGHRWGMVIDLAACTGCSACVVSCQAENNIPVVGEDEVRRRRDMAWMRIDRYYTGDPSNPAAVHQPMLCQHCENAPCETVCPVLATVHSSEGLNQQVYNRCVGTRYCANNCPPKVRRFNWFDYPHDDPVSNMVLNPDVVVRSRGVMEKCSLCAQRISAGKEEARIAGRPVADGDIRTACQQSCPANAIEFGDLNDPTSRVARLAKDGRRYRILPDLNLGEVVSYLTKVRSS